MEPADNLHSQRDRTLDIVDKSINLRLLSATHTVAHTLFLSPLARYRATQYKGRNCCEGLGFSGTLVLLSASYMAVLFKPKAGQEWVPTDFAVSKDGHLVVMDSRFGRLYMFDFETGD